MSKKLKDIVRLASPDEIPTHLRTLAQRLHILNVSIVEGILRTDESVTLANLGKRSAVELERLASFYPSPIEGAAWCTRNLFELNLVLRFVLMNPRNVSLWMGQLAGDEMQIIEGCLSLAEDVNNAHIKTLENRLADIAATCRRHGIDPSKPFRIEDIAKKVNCSRDYKALYKLFSKYVHPSSWLVNNPEENTQNHEILGIFFIHAQLYSSDTYGRLDRWLRERSTIH